MTCVSRTNQCPGPAFPLEALRTEGRALETGHATHCGRLFVLGWHGISLKGLEHDTDRTADEMLIGSYRPRLSCACMSFISASGTAYLSLDEQTIYLRECESSPNVIRSFEHYFPGKSIVTFEIAFAPGDRITFSESEDPFTKRAIDRMMKRHGGYFQVDGERKASDYERREQGHPQMLRLKDAQGNEMGEVSGTLFRKLTPEESAQYDDPF